MINKEYNYKYCNFSIVIRGGKGRAKLSDQTCFDVEGENHEDIKNGLECQVKEYWYVKWKELALKVDKLVLLGLSQIPTEFAKNLVQKMETYSKKWSQEARVCFGITGIISEGNPGSPNYQLQSLDGINKVAFYFNGDFFDATHFDESHITVPLSREEITAIWYTLLLPPK
jgi:hypothetical protein